MRVRETSAGLALAALLWLAVPAQGAVRFDFTQIGRGMWSDTQGGQEHMPAGYVAQGYLVLSDQAYANGIHWNFNETSVPDWSALGLLDFRFGVTTTPLASLSLSLADLQSPTGIKLFWDWAIDLGSAPGGTPSGSVLFNNTNSDFVFHLAGRGVSTVEYRSDAMTARCSGDDCSFRGTFALAVPEPAALAGFSLGLAGLAWARRRRRSGQLA